ncbi:Rho GTPase activation protein, partial [Rhizopus microsporus]
MEPYVRDMLQADKAYRELVTKVDKMRMQTEEALFMHYEEMESLELERIQTIKQVFISVAASLSNTIPRYKETVDNMMLYQETLKPDKDVQVIVEQHRTGQFCPRPVLYENYFYGAAHHQLFGVALDEVTRTEGTLIPNFMSKGMSVIESGKHETNVRPYTDILHIHKYNKLGLANLEAEEKHLVWITSLPLDRVHAARDQINQQYPVISQELLESYDVLLIASLIRLYLMELPECLLTFELYEPCKIIYSNQQDTETRLVSVSKLLTTLPTPNYHMCKVLFSHLNKLCDDQTLSRRFAHSFGYVLLRPQVESKVSTFERHPYRLIQDLIEHYDSIFTTESIKAQEENSSRTSIVVSKTSLDSLDSSRRRIRGHLIPSSSTLFEDPDELTSESTMNSTPPNYVGKEDTLELASLDSFFLDD